MSIQVPADPHRWPRDAGTAASACAVVVVDMQDDYCSAGYYMDRAGYDVGRLRAPVEPIQRVLSAARRAGLHVIYTRHGRAPAGGRAHATGHKSDEAGPPLPRTAARGEPGWRIVAELSPRDADVVIDKSTCSAFVTGELDRVLRERGITHLAVCGNTIDVCVHSTLRAAVDLDYECLLLEDCCGAVSEGLHAWAVESVRIENGVFGTVVGSGAFVEALAQAAR